MISSLRWFDVNTALQMNQSLSKVVQLWRFLRGYHVRVDTHTHTHITHPASSQTCEFPRVTYVFLNYLPADLYGDHESGWFVEEHGLAGVQYSVSLQSMLAVSFQQGIFFIQESVETLCEKNIINIYIYIYLWYTQYNVISSTCVHTCAYHYCIPIDSLLIEKHARGPRSCPLVVHLRMGRLVLVTVGHT